MLKVEEVIVRQPNKSLVQKISLEFGEGSLFGILGPNGAGKTTFLKSLCGLLPIYGGAISWRDENLLKKTRKEISKIISHVPQNLYCPFDFSVFSFVSMGRYLHDTGNTSSIIVESLQLVDALHLQHRYINQLSQGEKQRIYLARAIATEAPILLLDEPVSNLDLRHQLDFWELMKKMTQKGKTLLVASHDLRSTKRYCDEIVVFQEGHCLGKGKFDTLLSPEIFHRTFGLTPCEIE